MLNLLTYNQTMSEKKSRLSSIVRKVLMALSGLFLMSFLVMHLSVNMMSLVSEELFNAASHFMGTNAVVQGLLQPILVFGVVFHFVMGMIIEMQNRKARQVKYAKFNGSANATWVSRNMIYSGLVVLAFLLVHFMDFWIPELTEKYVVGNMDGLNEHGHYRYFEEMQHQFHNPLRVGVYVVSFIFLALHLLHGFQSSFQSVGFNSRKYSPMIKKFGNAFAIIVPLGFIIIALYHFINQ
jgi:succinate dehydrogenase / fumarate reductase cytochrome b subunit